VGGSLLDAAPLVGFDPPQFADLPSPGDRIEKGHPILTLFATSSSTRDCLKELEQRARALDRWLYGET
jgi:predicted ATP-grasp superfamily ATP-dependent carboligase